MWGPRTLQTDDPGSLLGLGLAAACVAVVIWRRGGHRD